MLKLLRTATLSLVAGLGTLAALPAAAQADTLYFGFGDEGAGFGVVPADDGWGGFERNEWDRRHEWRRDDRRRGGWRRDDWRRDRGPRCTAERALGKAQRLGLHRVYVRDVDRDTIRISGRRHGERITVTFARAPFCPVVGL